MNHLFEEAKFTRVITAQAAGQGDVNSTVLDMAGFDHVSFEVALGTLSGGSVVTVKIQEAVDLAFTIPLDLTDTAVDVADTESDKIVLTGVIEPTEQFVRCVVTRATADAVVDSGVGIQHHARDLEVTQDATTVVTGTKFRITPLVGTP